MPPIAEDEGHMFCDDQSTYVGDHIVPIFTWIRPEEMTDIYIEERDTENEHIKKMRKEVKYLEEKFKKGGRTGKYIGEQWKEYLDKNRLYEVIIFERAKDILFSSDDNEDGDDDEDGENDDPGDYIFEPQGDSFLNTYEGIKEDKEFFEEFLKFLLVVNGIDQRKKESLKKLLTQYTGSIENDEELSDYKNEWNLIIEFWSGLEDNITTPRRSSGMEVLTSASSSSPQRTNTKRKSRFRGTEEDEDADLSSEKKRRRPSPPKNKNKQSSPIVAEFVGETKRSLTFSISKNQDAEEDKFIDEEAVKWIFKYHKKQESKFWRFVCQFFSNGNFRSIKPDDLIVPKDSKQTVQNFLLDLKKSHKTEGVTSNRYLRGLRNGRGGILETDERGNYTIGSDWMQIFSRVQEITLSHEPIN